MTSDIRQERYLTWLMNQVRPDSGYGGKVYRDLFVRLQCKEFIWIVPHDDNRIVDALNLRVECFPELDAAYLVGALGPCSVLEVIVEMSRRMSFLANGSANQWAWQLLTNLELHRMSNHLGRRRVQRFDEIIETLLFRTYEPNGQGGFFPLAWPEEDQRKVELWYQLNAYIDEIHEP